MDLERAEQIEATERERAQAREVLYRKRLREQADRRAAEDKRRAERAATDADGVVERLEQVHATLTGLGALAAVCQEEGSILIHAAAQALAVARRRQARLRQQD